MSLKLHLADLPIERVAFNYSVLYELLVSLRVLDDYKHHPLHINWAVETMKQLPLEFRTEQKFFRVIIREVLNLWQPEYAEEPSFHWELEQLRKWSIHTFIEPIIMVLTHNEPPSSHRKIAVELTAEDFQANANLQLTAEAWVEDYYPESAGIVEMLINHPEALKQRFIDFINLYWEIHFEEQWHTLEPLFFQEVRQRGQLLYNNGISATLKQLTPRTHVDDTAQTVTFVSASRNENLQLNQHGYLNLYPSYFLYPHTLFMINDDGNQTSITALSITYPMSAIQQAGRSPILEEDLVAMLRALSDPTRLQIIKLIAHKARSTRELSEIIGISDAAISKHLKMLQRSGWVTTQRASYYVLYQATPERLTDLRYALGDLFQQ